MVVIGVGKDFRHQFSISVCPPSRIGLVFCSRLKVASFFEAIKEKVKIGRRNKNQGNTGSGVFDDFDYDDPEPDFIVTGKSKGEGGRKGKGKKNRRNKGSKMGQEESHPVDPNTRPSTLSSRTIDGVAEYIKSGRCSRIVVMTGAGISTSAGIPDFRSPDTGLYANLARLNLPYAEAVFDISYFRNNPDPFYTLAHELYPGKFRPTITHSFVALLQKKGLLHMLFTQNIDCLEREAGVTGDNIVEAHGSFATQRCIDCKREYPGDKMREMVSRKEVPRCVDEACNGLVKPDIVFFGEQLPAAFFHNRNKPDEADLAIVLGTSLTVQPFASLPQFVAQDKPRVLINLERVGAMGSRADDVLILGDCDDGVRKLAEACGWLEELEAEWAKTAPKAAMERLQQTTEPAEEREKTKDEKLQEEVDKLTRDVDETLKINEGHKNFLEKHLADKAAKHEDKVAENVAVESHDRGAARKDTSSSEPLATKGDETLERSPHTAVSEVEHISGGSNTAPKGGGDKNSALDAGEKKSSL